MPGVAAAALLAELHDRADVLLRARGSTRGCTARGSPRCAPGRACRSGCGPRRPRRRSASPRTRPIGIVAISSRSYSRSSRSRTMSMCSRPRKPQRKPKPSASEVSGSHDSAASLSVELLERVAQLRVVVGVDREQAAEHHRLDLAVAGQRLGRRVGLGRQRVADAQLRDVLDAGDHVADLAGARAPSTGVICGREEADVVDVGLGAGRPSRGSPRPCSNVPSTTRM